MDSIWSVLQVYQWRYLIDINKAKTNKTPCRNPSIVKFRKNKYKVANRYQGSLNKTSKQ